MWRLSGLVLGLLMLACPKNPETELPAQVRADGYYLASQTAYVKGDFAAAHAALDKVKQILPDDPRLSAAMGELLLSEGKLDEAVVAFEAAAKADPKRGTTWSRLGYLYSLKGEAKAVPALEKALAANAADLNAHETLGDLALKRGDIDAGVMHTVRAGQLAIDDQTRSELVLKAFNALMRTMRGDEATALLRQAVDAGRLTSEVYVELGDRIVSQRNLAEAVAVYVKAAEVDPHDPTLWEIVGEVRSELGQIDGAKEAFTKSLQVQQRGVVHVALARLCRKEKNDACFQRELDAALETASGAELREALELAALLADVGRRRDALALYKTVANEPEAASDFDLQLRTARLAKELKDTDAMVAACGKATKLKVGARCP
jgi:tetratricopeptide (TPR) repeat protein